MNKLSVAVFSLAIVVACAAFLNTASSRMTDDEAEVVSRSFEFGYGATIHHVPANSTVRVWFPVAESNHQQDIMGSKFSTPSTLQFNRDETYHNQIGYFELVSTDQEPIELKAKYKVVRREATVDGAAAELTEAQKQLFLSANKLIPLDGKPQTLIKDTRLPSDPMEAGKILYQFVGKHMAYDKSQPGYGNGDANWACDSKTGNCTDFHSLFISLARSRKIPAQFEIGFPIPSDKSEGEIGGYHCWAWFYAATKGWAPVDISEADKHPELSDYYFGKLTADRIAFSNGRDIELVPESKSEPLNYFVYPYVEVDGKPWPKENIQLDFSFKNKQ